MITQEPAYKGGRGDSHEEKNPRAKKKKSGNETGEVKKSKTPVKT